MRGDWKRTRDGHEYQEWRFSTEELREDVLRYRMTPEEARRFLLFIRWLIDKLLTTKSDARRVAAVNMLQKFLTHGYRSISNLAALSKIANGRVNPKTHRFEGDLIDDPTTKTSV